MQRAAFAAVLVLTCVPLSATETERLYLSGTGPHDAVEWEFSIDSGRRAGELTTIPVPSQWELEGFGEFAYGQDDEVRAEFGSYRTSFSVPDEWRGRRIDLVFDGAMTDTEATLNGRSVGERHRGGFTRFAYDVSDLVRFDAENELEVGVWEASGDRTVNAAERQADYWVFGGIYRPVYLESRPAPGISHVAVDARHDGRITVMVEVDGGGTALRLSGEIIDGGGLLIGRLAPPDGSVGDRLTMSGSFPDVSPWSADEPALYTVRVDLQRDGEVVHTVRERFGFRTIDVRPGEGLFVNGRRTLLKGINRHSFWPESGRALTPDQNRRDVELIKELNANAVRTSHYPPDESFLEACDELGLYVIDELPGWHDPYRASVGKGLVGEMVRRDVNHPSVILWANGNEGGWNPLLDREFSRHDPQDRPVLHPQAVFGGFDTFHYPSWEQLRSLLAGDGWATRLRGILGRLPFVMPTEMLHGLYDGGLGAGLADFWALLSESPRGAGGFLWSFVDEGVVRGDRAGAVDTFGNYAADGIVGPYREKEASFATVRAIWSPVKLEGWEVHRQRIELLFGSDSVEPARPSLAFTWRWLRWPPPDSDMEAEVVALASGASPPAPSGAGFLDLDVLRIDLPPGADALEVKAVDPSGRIVEEWVVPVTERSELLDRWLAPVRDGEMQAVDTTTALEVIGLDPSTLATPVGPLQWRVGRFGWVRGELEAGTLALRDLIESEKSVEWLGRGPWPVWKNRLEGPDLGLWRGVAEPGFFDGVLWARVRDERGDLVVVVENEGVFTGFSAPEFPPDARSARAAVPPVGSLSFQRSIPPMGSKFHPGEALQAPGTGREREHHEPLVIWFRRVPADGD